MLDLIEALQIFSKYTEAEWPTSCEHDVLYVMVEWSLLSEQDKARLTELGFMEDEQHGYSMSFRFGSA